MKRLIFLASLILCTRLLFAVEDNRYKYINFNSTTTVSIVPVKLHSIVISSAAAVPFFVYDSTSSTVLTPVISSFTASTPAGTYLYDLQTEKVENI